MYTYTQQSEQGLLVLTYPIVRVSIYFFTVREYICGTFFVEAQKLIFLLLGTIRSEGVLQLQKKGDCRIEKFQEKDCFGVTTKNVPQIYSFVVRTGRNSEFILS